ncbi:MAG: menaquinone-dependent protoporphyrinogen IX dehydrogenase [Propionibacteriaceae bacterium]|jgi:menaquinone-dependent protoporphyrinogen oxidase|nr:menaquinone-dependent protoporphyrinogen IX dehydrogenase [Propionibacteriaceae bacterium]
MSVLILHSSRFGQSEKIARAIADELEAGGLSVEIAPITKKSDPQGYDGLALVMSVRYGFFSGLANKLIKKYRSWLDTHPTLLVTVSLTARNPEKRDPAVHSYTRKFLEKVAWAPTHTEVVAGALRYPIYNIFDRKAIQLIMHITNGETDPTKDIEYTDWEQVAQAGKDFAGIVQASK